MKKICQILLALFILSLCIQVVYLCMSTGYTLKYDIKEGKKHFLVEEKYQSGKKGVSAHYEIRIDGTFSLQIYDHLRKDSHLIQKIYQYQDDTYTCIYPVFKSKKIKRDVLCSDGTKQIYYQNIKGNKGLDTFVSKISSYDESNFKDLKEETQKEGFVTLYTDNLLMNHYITIQSYKGVYALQKKEKNPIRTVDLYHHDVYDPKISAMVSKYFVTADYEDTFSFDKFYVLDSTGNSTKEINTGYDISYDSYVQGVVGNALYFVDVENKRQYKVDVKEKRVQLIGDREKGIQFYEKGKWIHKDMKDALDTPLLFQNNQSSDSTYYLIEDVPASSYTYFFEKKDGKVKVYRKGLNFEGNPTFLFEIEGEVKMIQYAKNYLYFSVGKTIYYYSDETGLRTLAKHSEFSFNKDLQFFVYVK